MSKLDSRIDGLALAIENEMVLGESGIVSLPKGFEAAVLPEGQTVESHAAHDDTKADLVAATNLALGRVSQKAFKANPDLKTVQLATPLFKANKLELEYQRVKTIPKPGSTTGETITKYGANKISLTMQAVNKNAGALKQVTAHLAAEFANLAS